VGAVKKQLALVYAGYLFRYAYLIVLIPFYARVLGAEAYGVVLGAMTVYSMVWTVQNWGFSGAGSRNIATSSGVIELQQHEMARHITARLILLPVALVVGAITVIQAPLLREHMVSSLAAMACGVLAGFNVGWFFQGRMNFNTPIAIEVLGFASMLLLVLSFVKGPADNELVMLLLLASTLTSTVLAYLLVRRVIPLKLANLADGWALIKESFPLFVSAGTWALMLNIGTYSLAMMSTADQVAYFGTAEKIAATGLGLLGPAGQFFVTLFSKMVHESASKQSVLEKQLQASRWVILGGAMGTIACLTFVPPVLDFALGDKFLGASDILRVLSPLFVLAAFNHAVAVYLLLPRRLDGFVSKAAAGAALIGVGLTFWGASVAGGVGAALGRVAGEAVYTAFLVAYCSKNRKDLFG
jgi:O-antigen/teichoic acid export membrane protein